MEAVELVAARLRVRPAPPAGDETCLRLEGMLDGEAALPLARVLLDAQRVRSEVVLDLSRLSMVDAAGLRVLVDAARRTCAVGCDLVLRHPSPTLRRLFRVAGVEAWAELDDEGCVVASLPPGRGRFRPRAGTPPRAR